MALVSATCDPKCFYKEGFASRVNVGGEKIGYATNSRTSDIVRFLSRKDDANGAHAAVKVRTNVGIFPPSTLFRLVKVHVSSTCSIAACILRFH